MSQIPFEEQLFGTHCHLAESLSAAIAHARKRPFTKVTFEKELAALLKKYKYDTKLNASARVLSCALEEQLNTAQPVDSPVSMQAPEWHFKDKRSKIIAIMGSAVSDMGTK